MKEHEVRYDYTNMLSDAVGEHGVTADEIAGVSDRFEEVFATLSSQRAEGILGFMDLPYDETAAGKAMKTAAALKGRFENLVVLGIGGSALGTIALKSALCHPLHNLLDASARGGRPRLFVLDNVDPDFVFSAAEFIDVEKTLFSVVTKAGGTAETMAQLVIFENALREAVGDDAGGHVVATTDPEKGDLRKMVSDFGWASLPIPSNVGGRFSVLTCVGLFPAAMLGIDVRQLLSGAAFMDRRSESRSIDENPALAFATLQYCLYRKGAPISVLMPYCNALYDLADWYRQLWAESLGKKSDSAGRVVNTGPTPVKALGATDQHSQIQLYAAGPYDKSITFIEVEKFRSEVPIPEALKEYESAAALAGRTLNELLSAEKRGTEVALTEAGRPNGTLLVPEVSAFTVGQLFYLFEMATAISGALYGINAFVQPGVEAGKVAAYALMGLERFKERRAEIERMQAKPRKIV
jgi:glucose-6-phosphate isomerase